jgi:hypothetical protein
MFEVGRNCIRRRIHKRLGGGIQDYLPHKDGRMVCGCFVPRLNPNAPREILVGRGPEIRRWANVFQGQGDAVPVFLKRASRRWEYVGDWRVKSSTNDPSEIGHRRRQTGRTDITMLLFLTEGCPAPIGRDRPRKAYNESRSPKRHP